MKKAMSLFAVGVLSVTGTAGVSMAGARTDVSAKAVNAQTDAWMRQALELRASLKPAQRQALMDAARNWGIYPDANKVMAQAEKDINRIMTPAQAEKFMDLVNPQVSSGGYYMRVLCVANSTLGILFSLVGLIGCGGEVSAIAAVDSWAAFIFANNCLLTGATSCESAVSAAYNSAGGWASLIETCDVADTAYYTMALTYATCGGTW